MASEKKYATYPSLVDRTVVISGGATGIGASLVEHFALQGARVYFLDIQTAEAEALIETLTTTHKLHQAPVFYHCDLLDIDGAVRPTASKITAAAPGGQVHILINNAARDARRKTLEISTSDWDGDMQVNLRHIFFLTQSLLPALILGAEKSNSTSSVINMGSISWAIPSTGVAPYASAKAAIMGLTKTLGKEFGIKGVRVNSIMPGAVATERQLREIITPEYEREVLRGQAMKRLLVPGDVSRMALWLAAEDSSGVTQQSFVVDCGWI